LHPALRPFILFIALCVVTSGLIRASAQAAPTATRMISPSVFAGVTGVSTGLDSSSNISITAGLDLTFRPLSKLQPTLEYRGTYPIDKGEVASLQNNLGGLKLSTYVSRLHPYADILVGRSETTYLNGGYQVPNKPIFYTQSSSNVFSLGSGADLFATEQLALKVDLQVQRSSSPVTASGHLYSASATIGVVYVLRLGHTAYRQ
jgi:hypothetical protein